MMNIAENFKKRKKMLKRREGLESTEGSLNIVNTVSYSIVHCQGFSALGVLCILLSNQFGNSKGNSKLQSYVVSQVYKRHVALPLSPQMLVKYTNCVECNASWILIDLLWTMIWLVLAEHIDRENEESKILSDIVGYAQRVPRRRRVLNIYQFAERC